MRRNTVSGLLGRKELALSLMSMGVCNPRTDGRNGPERAERWLRYSKKEDDGLRSDTGICNSSEEGRG